MWMGLTSKSANIAALKTFVFVLIIPVFVFSFVSAIGASLLLMPLLRTSGPGNPSWAMIWYPLAMTAVSSLLSLGKDLGFLFWSRNRLYSQFRIRSVRDAMPIQALKPPRLPKPNAPPVIAGT